MGEYEAVAFMVVFTTLIVGGTILLIVKTVYKNKAQWGKDSNLQVPPMFEKLFAKNVAERDEKMRKMEERIQVLEKIVTDTHGSSKLAAEIDKLRDA